jgi:hypothetical protein
VARLPADLAPAAGLPQALVPTRCPSSRLPPRRPSARPSWFSPSGCDTRTTSDAASRSAICARIWPRRVPTSPWYAYEDQPYRWCRMWSPPVSHALAGAVLHIWRPPSCPLTGRNGLPGRPLSRRVSAAALKSQLHALDSDWDLRARRHLPGRYWQFHDAGALKRAAVGALRPSAAG